MGKLTTLIGTKLPTIDEKEGDNPPLEMLKENMTQMRAWLKGLYAEVIDNRENTEWAEADAIVVTDENSNVVDAWLARFSVDDEPEYEDGAEFESFEQFADAQVQRAHKVPNARFWIWFHIHPEGMSTPSQNDENKVPTIGALDLIATGHTGGPRLFQHFAITQRAGIVALSTEKINGISPRLDARTARVFSNSYDRVLGVSHPMAEAMNAIATAMEAFAETFREPGEEGFNPLEQLMGLMEFSMQTIRPLQEKLSEARANLEISDEEFKDRLHADYPKWVEEGKGSVERVAPPVAPAETLGTSELPELPAGILADLSGFDFSGLDA